MRTYLFYVRTSDRNPITRTLDRIVLPGGKACYVRTEQATCAPDDVEPAPLPEEDYIGAVTL
jgi:hypothetical protein